MWDMTGQQDSVVARGMHGGQRAPRWPFLQEVAEAGCRLEGNRAGEGRRAGAAVSYVGRKELCESRGGGDEPAGSGESTEACSLLDTWKDSLFHAECLGDTRNGG